MTPSAQPDHWKTEIARIVHWKQIAAQHDKKQALPWHLPEVGAPKDAVARAESELSAPFSDEYRSFLSLANGWKGFYVLIDLFGTDDFLSGRADEVTQRPEIESYLSKNGLTRKHVIPIGASSLEIDAFLLVSPASAIFPGAILWWAGEEIDCYSSFREFLGAMVNYNALIAQKMVQRAESKGDIP